MAQDKAAIGKGGWRVLAALLAGLLLGIAVARTGDGWREPAIRWGSTIGGIWLDALKVTVVPLIVALLVTGIAGTVRAASGGRIAGRSMIWFAIVYLCSALVGAMTMPALIQAFPLPDSATEALQAGLAGVDRAAAAASVPSATDFLRSIVPSNILAAASANEILPLVAFTLTFAFAITRIERARREQLVQFFQSIEQAMLVMIGWVLWIAPVGVFALGVELGAGVGGAALGAILHYVVLVSLLGLVVMIAGYVIALLVARWPLGEFSRAMIQPQTVAISTRSSLASLPAMLAAARQLKVPEEGTDIVLPMAVALFRATGPAMNLGVAIYVAYWLGVDLHPAQIAAGIGVAAVASYWAVSLPGQLSFVTSIAPIALAMGLPIEPLAILIAVETLPDTMRTLGNVTMDVAVTGAVARKSGSEN